MDVSLVLVNAAVILILIGCMGLTLIGLPGNFVLFLTILGYAFFDDFAHIDWWVLGVVFGLIAAGELVETLMGAVWAKREQASRFAIGMAVAGTIFGGIAGTALLPVVGSVIGAFLGGFIASYAAEYQMTSDRGQAWRVAKSVFKGQLLGIVIKFSIAVATIIYLLIHMPW